jgi:hypothetical protein
LLPYNSAMIPAIMAIHDPAGDRRMNLVEVPKPVDVSGMEVDSALAVALASGADEVSQGVEDGAATGIGTTNLDTPAGDTAGWAANTPKAHAMSTSIADLDADDWINYHYDETGTIGDLFPSIHVNFIFGVPGGIG